MKILSILFFTIILPFCSVIAQNGIVTGKIADVNTKMPLSDVTIRIAEDLQFEDSSLSDGSFSFELSMERDYSLNFSKEGYEIYFLKVAFPKGGVIDLGTVEMEPFSVVNDEIPTVMLLDSEDDSDFASQNIISQMGSAADVYISKTSFYFGAVRFHVRGLDNEYNQTYINGVNFNDQIRGRFNYSMLGGLNDVTRNKDLAINTTPSSFGFGDVGGITNIDTKATSYGKGGRITASATNRNYKLRGIATYSTGLMDNGFAVTASMGYRWADEGYWEGTFYNGYSYLLSVEKIMGSNKQHSLSLTTIGAPTQRGQNGAVFQEIYDLPDNKRYNPNWGYQNGVKRNAKVVTSNDPMAVLSHKWQITNNMQLTTGLGARYNQYGVTALNWHEASDPRPDYYRYIPSYYDYDKDKIKNGNAKEKAKANNDSIKYELYSEIWESDKTVRQIDWYKLYEANYWANIDGKSASYILEERHSNLLELAFNSLLKSNINNHQSLEAGIEVKKTRGIYFKTINDLLGANYWIDVDQFAERDFRGNTEMKQNDLEHPDRKVKKGDIFGYKYDLNVNHVNLWIQNRYFYPKADFYYAVKISYTEFQREGYMKNGRAPDNSLGKGNLHSFDNHAIKGGFTYKITGRHFIDINLLYETKSPLPYDSYLSPRIKDDAVPELCSERVVSADISYLISLPLIRGRITAFQTNFYDQNEIYNVYYDALKTFSNYVMTGINKIHHGVEVGAIISPTSRLKINLVGTVAEYFYNSRPTGYATYENGSQPSTTETVYFKNFYVGGTPQIAGSIGLSYALPKYWYFDVNYNYFDRIYVDPIPMRRTEAAVDMTADTSKELKDRINEITKQEKYPAGGTLDASIGKSIRFKKGYFLNFNCSVNNILNNTNLKTGGFENARFNYDTNTIKVRSKYYYAQGINYFFNAAFRF